ncbi:Mitochondrial arginine transporter BAC2 [Balamuthia mandrillaris]
MQQPPGHRRDNSSAPSSSEALTRYAKATPSIQFIGGVAGAMAGTIAGHPLDTLKVRLQTSPAGTYSGALDCLYKTLKWEGPRGLFKGLSAPLATRSIMQASSFYGYGVMLPLVQRMDSTAFGGGAEERGQAKLWHSTVAGAAAGVVTSLVIAPGDLIKIRLQIQIHDSSAFPGPVAGTRKLLQEEGIRGLYRGLTATVAREIVTCSVFFTSYLSSMKYIQQRWHSYHSTNEKSGKEGGYSRWFDTMAAFIAGCVAGSSCWAAAYPIDLWKSEVQKSGKETYQTFASYVSQCIERHGIRGLYRGLFPTLLRSLPVNGAKMVAYDMTLRWLLADKA